LQKILKLLQIGVYREKDIGQLQFQCGLVKLVEKIIYFEVLKKLKKLEE
jgi:hypothetical protein